MADVCRRPLSSHREAVRAMEKGTPVFFRGKPGIIVGDQGDPSDRYYFFEGSRKEVGAIRGPMEHGRLGEFLVEVKEEGEEVQ